MGKKYLPVWLINFVNIIGYSLLIPVYPAIIALYAKPGQEGWLFGLMQTSYAACQFLGAPILGSLSDKYGRKAILLISQIGTVIGWLIFGSAYFVGQRQVGGISLALLIIMGSRILDGLTGGNISVANAWISDVTAKEDRTKIFGMTGAIFGMGFLIGPALGGFSSNTTIGYLGSIILVTIIALITAGLIFWMLPESLPESKRDKEWEFNLAELNIVKKVKKFSHNREIIRLLWTRLFFALSFAAFTTTFVLYTNKYLHLNSFQLGLSLSLIGIFSIINQALLTHRIVRRLGEVNSLIAGFSIFGVCLALIPFIPTQWFWANLNLGYIILMIDSYVLNLGTSMAMPIIKTLLTKNVEESKQGVITGIDESLLALGNAISPIIAGAIFTGLGARGFWIFALILLVPYYIWQRRETVSA
jgi:MFS family permease